MIKSTQARQKAVSSAVGSVRAEGLRPSNKTQNRLQRYANGTISAKSLRRVTISEIRISPSSKIIMK